MAREVKLHALLTLTVDASKRSASCWLLYFQEQIPSQSLDRRLHGLHSCLDMTAKRKIPEIWGSHGSEYIKITVIWDVIPTTSSLVDRYHATCHHIADNCNQKYSSLCWELSPSGPTGSLSLHLLSSPGICLWEAKQLLIFNRCLCVLKTFLWTHAQGEIKYLTKLYKRIYLISNAECKKINQNYNIGQLI